MYIVRPHKLIWHVYEKKSEKLTGHVPQLEPFESIAERNDLSVWATESFNHMAYW